MLDILKIYFLLQIISGHRPLSRETLRSFKPIRSIYLTFCMDYNRKHFPQKSIHKSIQPFKCHVFPINATLLSIFMTLLIIA